MKTKAIVSAGVTAVVAAAIIAQPALAWHPKGVIVKKAYNVTTNGPVKDANSVRDAVTAKPGDTIRYIIEVSNTAEAAEKQYNDMDFVVMTDKLPAGVQPTSSSNTQIRENLGLIVPKKKVVKEYDVKVTSTKDGDVITNEACFTGDSVVRDNPQSGCDKAIIKVEVPEVPKTPEQPKPEQPKPETPKAQTPAPEQPAALPQTGMEAVGAVAGTSVLGYATSAYLRSKRALGKAFRK